MDKFDNSKIFYHCLDQFFVDLDSLYNQVSESYDLADDDDGMPNRGGERISSEPRLRVCFREVGGRKVSCGGVLRG